MVDWTFISLYTSLTCPEWAGTMKCMLTLDQVAVSEATMQDLAGLSSKLPDAPAFWNVCR
jgi:hypothetical protein